MLPRQYHQSSRRLYLTISTPTLTGNYYVVYPRDRMDTNERIRQTLPLESLIIIAHAYYTHLLIMLQWFKVVLSGTRTRSLMILSGLVGGSIVGICINQGRI